MKQIDVQFAAGNGGQKTFPIVYAVENREEECMQIFRCTIDLPVTKMPSWLPAKHFDLVTHIRDGMQLVDYNASLVEGPVTQDTDAFRYKVYAEIFFQEKRKRKEAFPSC